MNLTNRQWWLLGLFDAHDVVRTERSGNSLAVSAEGVVRGRTWPSNLRALLVAELVEPAADEPAGNAYRITDLGATTWAARPSTARPTA